MLPDNELKLRAKAHYAAAKEHAKEWRDGARREYDMVAGHQISKENLEALRVNKRPAVQFNIIAPNIKAVSGMEKGNRYEIKYAARDEDKIDRMVSTLLNPIVKWVHDTSQNEFEESAAFRDMCICGMGWTQTRVDYDDDPKGQINSPNIDPLKKLWDPSSRKENLTDRRFDFTESFFDKDEFEFLFPDFEGTPKRTIFDSTPEDEEGSMEVENLPDNYEGEASAGDLRFESGKKYAVLEYNFYLYEPMFRATIPNKDDPENGEPTREEVGEKGKERLKAMGLPEEFFEPLGNKKRFYRAWFTGDELIEQTVNADPSSFTDHCMTGELDRNKGTFFGVVRAMIDPQMWTNQLFMQMLHIINTNSKGGGFFRKGAFANKVKALKDWAKGDTLIEIAGMGDIREWITERTPAPLPAAMHELLLFVVGIIPRVSGFNMELLGMAGKDQPGILEQMRKQAGMTILAPFFDAQRHYRRVKGRTMIHFIQEYLPRERAVKILSDGLKPQVDLLYQTDATRFNVVVEEAPHSPNLKATNFVMLQEFMQTNPELGTAIFDLILEQSPMPADLAAKITQRLADLKKPDPLQQAAQGAELKKLIAEGFKLEMEAAFKRAQTVTEGGKLDLEQDKLDQSEIDSLRNFLQVMKTAEVAKDKQESSNGSK